ncbi:condensation domain-containing protein [Chitinophaga sp.]|uniref:condensation domain-containing protein n=1 Tax=Chitinophaga sp. TaxID=1869181 RepID=UPI002B899E98|nr:condensation domain-containing protein [Chitinophaga sp.]HWV64273.1 condensation domain-containing protein [Chitinophaga sp.]
MAMQTIYDATLEQVQCYHYHAGLDDLVQHQILMINVDTENLEIPVVRQAIAVMAGKHDSLRTAFTLTDDGLKQYVLPYDAQQVPFYYYDISDAPDMEASMKQKENEWRVRLKPAHTPPLWCCYVLKTGKDTYCLTLLIHHLISDGWSLSVMLRDVNNLYWSILNKEPVDDSPAPAQLRHYVEWQKEWMATRKGELTAYWHNKLSWFMDRSQVPKLFDLMNSVPEDDHPVTPSPLLTDKEVTAFLNREEAACYICDIEPELYERMSALAMVNKVGLGAVIIVSLRLLLLSEIDRERMLIAMPVSGRYSPGFENIIGYLGGGIYLGNPVDQRQSVSESVMNAQVEFLESVRHVIYDHHLVGQDGGKVRVFSDIYLNFKSNKIIGDRNIGPVREKVHQPLDGLEYYALSYFAAEFADGIECCWKYNLNLYTASTVERFAEKHLAVLRLMCEYPTWPVSRITGELRETV